jgi:hypothetical protein
VAAHRFGSSQNPNATAVNLRLRRIGGGKLTGMRETVILAVALFLIGIMAAPLVVDFVVP